MTRNLIHPISPGPSRLLALAAGWQRHSREGVSRVHLRPTQGNSQRWRAIKFVVSDPAFDCYSRSTHPGTLLAHPATMLGSQQRSSHSMMGRTQPSNMYASQPQIGSTMQSQNWQVRGQA